MSIITDPWKGYGVTQGYGPAAPGNPYNEPVQFGAVPFHDGIDYAVPSGTAIPAPFAGTVTQAGDSGDGYGVKVAIQASNGDIAFYGHMETASVNVGQSVVASQLLGYSDNTGNSTGPHIHVGAHTASGGTLNPDSFPSPGTALATTPASTANPLGGILATLQSHPKAVAWGVAGLVAYWLW